MDNFRMLGRVLRLLTMVVWVGGLIFFAFVVAPVAFTTLASTHEAGLVVGGSLRALHWMGLASAVLFLLASAGELRHNSGLRLASLLAAVMLALTAWSQFGILPVMEKDRVAAGGVVGDAAPGDAARHHFDRLHHLSERVEGAVLLVGLAVVWLLGTQRETVRGAASEG